MFYFVREETCLFAPVDEKEAKQLHVFCFSPSCCQPRRPKSRKTGNADYTRAVTTAFQPNTIRQELQPNQLKPVWLKRLIPIELADEKNVNNLNLWHANCCNGCQTSNVWRRNMSRSSRESSQRGSLKQQTKITVAARARTLNRFQIIFSFYRV